MGWGTGLGMFEMASQARSSHRIRSGKVKSGQLRSRVEIQSERDMAAVQTTGGTDHSSQSALRCSSQTRPEIN